MLLKNNNNKCIHLSKINFYKCSQIETCYLEKHTHNIIIQNILNTHVYGTIHIKSSILFQNNRLSQWELVTL